MKKFFKTVILSAFAENPEPLGFARGKLASRRNECEESASARFQLRHRQTWLGRLTSRRSAEKIPRALACGASFFLFFFFAPGICLAITPILSPTPTVPFRWGGLGTGQIEVTLPAQMCEYTSQKVECLDCIQNKLGSWTVLGCLSHNPADFASFILRFSLGIGGGAAFLAILWGSFYLLTSAGNPRRIEEGKRIITYAIIGLLLIIFSLFILELVGVRILGIPGFGG